MIRQFIGYAMILLFFSSGCEESGQSGKMIQPATNATWQTVGSWQGTTSKNTPPFKIQSNQWRVKWKFNANAPDLGVFYVNVKIPGEGAAIEESVMHHTGSASDLTYVYKKGTFYLDIGCSNGNWSVSVEELK